MVNNGISIPHLHSDWGTCLLSRVSNFRSLFHFIQSLPPPLRKVWKKKKKQTWRRPISLRFVCNTCMLLQHTPENSSFDGKHGGTKNFWILSNEANVINQLSYPNIRKSIHLYTSSDTYSKHRVARNLSENQVIIIPISPTNSIAMS